MIRVAIVAHEPLATAFKAVAMHVFPECAEDLLAVDISPDDDREQATARVLVAVGADADTLILTDVFGATPCHAAMAAADGRRVRVVAGMCVPMLWRVLCYRAESLDDLVARAMDGATRGLMSLSTSRPQNQINRSSVHAQVLHHDQ
jgi:PTS system ascorbate-specific IIA component